MIQRRDRLIKITSYLLTNPNQLVNLHPFMRHFKCSKSSLSNDITIINHDICSMGLGKVKTSTGAAGGLIYRPLIRRHDIGSYIRGLIVKLNQKNRHLPGGYVYISDLLSNPSILKRIGKIIATLYRNVPIDMVLTMSNKSAIAPFIANFLNVPFIISQRHSKVSDGAVMSVNCFSADSKRIKQLVLPRRSLSRGSRVLIAGDFLKGGSSINGMISLVRAFDCDLAGIAIFADESNGRPKPFKARYQSLIKFRGRKKGIKAILGNFINL